MFDQKTKAGHDKSWKTQEWSLNLFIFVVLTELWFVVHHHSSKLQICDTWSHLFIRPEGTVSSLWAAVNGTIQPDLITMDTAEHCVVNFVLIQLSPSQPVQPVETSVFRGSSISSHHALIQISSSNGHSGALCCKLIFRCSGHSGTLWGSIEYLLYKQCWFYIDYGWKMSYFYKKR